MGATALDRCFICSSLLDKNSKEESVQSRSTIKESSVINGHHYETNLPHKLVFQYLVNACQVDSKKGSFLLQEIENLKSIDEDDGNVASVSLVRFCGFCNQQAARVKSLHLQLEVIQMKLIDELKRVKQCVIRNSRFYGSKDGVRLQSQKSEDWLDQHERIGEERKKEQKFLEVLQQFQTAVFESDIQLRNIPLVFLTKYVGEKPITIVKPESTESLEVAGASAGDIIVKEELMENSDYEEPIETHAFQEDESEPEPHMELKRKVECLTATADHHDSTPRKRRKHGRKVKMKTTKRILASQLTSKAKAPRKEKIIRKKVDSIVPARSSSSRTAANAANKLFKELRDPTPRYQVITKIVVPAPNKRRRTNPNLTEARKLATEIRKKRMAKYESPRNVRKHWICEECSFKTKVPYRMEQHYREHEGTEEERLLECPDCKKRFKRKQYFEHHILHYCGRGYWSCDVCEKPILWQQLKEHVDEHHEGKLYPCEYCDHKYVNYVNLLDHQNYHVLGRGSSYCLKCPEPKEFALKTHIYRHLYEVHGHTELLMTCNYENCSANFYSKASLIAHKAVHEEKYACEACESKFISNCLLETHVRVHHTKEKPFQCKHCEEKFFTNPSLEYHMMKHHNLVKYKCDICLQTFLNNTVLKNHKLREHGIGEVQYHPCDVCEKTFTSKKGLKAHQEVHTDKLNFSCEVCGFVTKTKNSLKSHMRLHGEKKFTCSYCQKRFAVSKYLRDHLRTHTLERPFQCEVCGSAFNQQGALNFHKKKHLEGKPFIPRGARGHRLKNGESKDDDDSCGETNQTSNEVPESSATMNENNVM